MHHKSLLLLFIIYNISLSRKFISNNRIKKAKKTNKKPKKNLKKKKQGAQIQNNH